MGWLILIALVVGAVGYWLIGAAALAMFFAVGSLPFWVLLVLAFLVAWAFVANEKGDLAAVPFLVFVLWVHFISKFDLIVWFRENWWTLLSDILLYLAFGFLYALFRWVLHLRRKASELDKLEHEFRSKHKISVPLDQASDKEKIEFAQSIAHRYNPNVDTVRWDVESDGVKPEFSFNIRPVGRWFWWWPISLLGWILNDLVREAWEIIKNVLEGVMNQLSNLVFGKRANYVLTSKQLEEYRNRPRE